MPKTIKSPWKIVSAAVIIVVIFLMFQRTGISQPVKSVVSTVTRPTQSFFSEAASRIKRFFWYFSDIKSTREENDQLKQTIAQLLVDNERLKESLQDSQLLQDETTYLNEHQLASVTARIIGSSSDNYSQTLLLNQGTTAGIQTGNPVITGNGIIVGKIIETQARQSKLLLLNDNHSQISAIIQNPTKSPGVISGRYALTLHMDLIPQDQEISQDQLVTTSGLEQGIPPDLVIGKITTITKEEGELFQQASVTPLIAYNTISLVSVIIPR